MTLPELLRDCRTFLSSWLSWRRLRRPFDVFAEFGPGRAEHSITRIVVGRQVNPRVVGIAFSGTVILPYRVVVGPGSHPVCIIAVAATVTHFGQAGRREADTLAGVQGEHQTENLEALMRETLVLEDDVTALTVGCYRCTRSQRASVKAELLAELGAYMN